MAAESLIGEIHPVTIVEVGSNSLFGALASSLPPPERGRSVREANRVGLPNDPHPRPPLFKGREQSPDADRSNAMAKAGVGA